MENNELQRDEYYLPGDLGTVSFGSGEHKIKKIDSVKGGAITITLSPKLYFQLNDISLTEDAEFEVIEPKQIQNGKPA